jgi:ABC-type microcin C transport system duplicated ATPase subunit YejF
MVRKSAAEQEQSIIDALLRSTPILKPRHRYPMSFRGQRQRIAIARAWYQNLH